MSSFTLNLNSSQSDASGDSQDFVVRFRAPITINENYEVALVSCNLWYSYPNVDATQYGNARFTYSPDNGATWKNIDFPTGTYTIQDLNGFIYDALVVNGDDDPDANGIPSIILRPNFNTLKVEIEITDTSAIFQVDLSTSNFYKLLGFTDAQAASPLIGVGVYTGDDVANINNDINKLIIQTSLLSTSGATYDNSLQGTTLYSFIPDVPPGANQDVVPSERLYIPMTNSMNYASQITQVRMTIRDNLGRLVNFRGEPVSYLLHIRPIR